MTTDPNVEAIVARFRRRSDAGILQYGCTTERADIDLFGWLNHLQEELMDAVVYIEAAKQRLAK